MTWFDKNAPPAAGANGVTPGPGYIPSPTNPNTYIQDPTGIYGPGPGGVPPSGGPSSSSGGAPSGGSLKDPAYVNQLIAYYASQPNADPSLKNDPTYWSQKILSGELGADQGYIVGKMQTGWQGGASGGGASGGGPGGVAAPSATAGLPAAFQPTPFVAPSGAPGPFVPPGGRPGPFVAPSGIAGVSPPTAPGGLQAGTSGADPTAAGGIQAAPGMMTNSAAGGGAPGSGGIQAAPGAMFTTSAAGPGAPVSGGTAPASGGTMGDDPGYAFRLQQGQNALQAAAAAHGSVLSGGTLKALDRYNQDYASGEYGNVFNRALSTAGFNENQYGNMFNQGLSGAQFGENQYGSRYNQAANTYGLNTGTLRNAQTDYWGRLRDLYQGGLSAANETYKPPPPY